MKRVHYQLSYHVREFNVNYDNIYLICCSTNVDKFDIMYY